MHRLFAGVGLAVGLLSRLADAQAPFDEKSQAPLPVAYLGISLQVGQAKGQFADYVDYGGGAGGYLVFLPNRRGIFGVRLDVMFLTYGSQTHRYQLVPGVAVDVTTDNEIFQFALAPQVTVGQEGLRAYGFGGVGGSFFATTSHVEGSDQTNQQFASTTNHSDGTFSWEAGGGVLVRVRRNPPTLLDIGVRYLKNGRVTYVTKDRVTISGNQLTVSPVASEANLMVYHLGIAIGVH
jgi:hypothetical protein